VLGDSPEAPEAIARGSEVNIDGQADCNIADDVISNYMRLVLDTDVIVAALRSPTGASSALLLAIDDGLAELLATVPLFLEYEAVSHRPEHMLASGLRAAELAMFFDRLVELVVPVEAWFLWRPQLRDPADEMVLEAAVNGQADALVTFNRRHFLPAAARFDLPVLLPGEILMKVRK